MINSYTFQNSILKKYYNLVIHDRMEIDNPDHRHPAFINYYNRFHKVIQYIRLHYPNVDEVKIGDFGCAQGNFSLLLAETGYRVYAIDLNYSFLKYSTLKYKSGDIYWITADVSKPIIKKNILDIAILIELIEHCAYPEDIIQGILQYIKPGGLMIITTPNGARLNSDVRSFKLLKNGEKRRLLHEKQFGPEGKDHLFLFDIYNIKFVLPNNICILDKGYTGGSILLINKYTKKALALISDHMIKFILKLLSIIPVINKKFNNGIYIVLQKTIESER